MHKARIAEWMLSLFTTGDRAASMAGDLVESAAGRRGLRFWWRLAQTAASLAWKSIAAEPLFMMGLAFRGLLLNLSLWFLVSLAMVAVALVGIFVAAAGGGTAALAAIPKLSGHKSLFSFVFFVLATVTGFAIQFQTGRWIARRARGREIAACSVFLAIGTILWMAARDVTLYAIERASRTHLPSESVVVTLLGNLIVWLPLLAGAVRVRRRSTPKGPA